MADGVNRRILGQCFSTGAIMSARRHLAMSGDIFGLSQLGVGSY